MRIAPEHSRRRARGLSVLGIGTLATALAGAFGLLPFVQTIELKTYDLRVAATARPPAPAEDIVLVWIDDDSIGRMEPLFGRWPWPRLVHATAIDFLAAAGAKVIAYDILFPDRDLGKFMIEDDEWTGEESDAALVESTRKAGNVVHAAEASSTELNDPSRALAENLDAPALNVQIPSPGCIQSRPLLRPPFPALAQASRGIGHTLFVLDPDGPVRRIAPVVQVGERTIPSLALATTMAAGAAVSVEARTDAGQCASLVAWRGPAENEGGHPTFSSYSFYDIYYSQRQILEGLKPDVDPAAFKDAIVVVGGSGEGLKEAFTTPFPAGAIDGPEVHANVIDGLLTGRSITRAEPWVGVALTVGLAFAVAAIGYAANAWVTAVASLVILLALAGYSWLRFASGAWIPLAVPTLAIAFAFVGDLAWKYVVEGREKRQVKKLFSRYVSKDVYDQLVGDPSLAALGGARRTMTVLFSDVRGFTAMSEKGTPEDVVGQLNEYFSRMVSVVFDHRGTVDKFVGDMVMALFGAPLDDEDHAEHAVQTALAMTTALNQLNTEWERQGRPTLDIGIGINTGDMVAGNIGSDTIMSYTVIGDAVNLGARLESLNKDYGTRIIISEATRSRLKGRYDIHPLGDVVVKGKSKPVAIFEVKNTMMRSVILGMTLAGLSVGLAEGRPNASGPSLAVAEAEGRGEGGGRQLGQITKGVEVAKKANEVRDLSMTDAEEQELGAAVSERIRTRYGVVQDAAVHRYLALLGTALAQGSTRPALPWTFVVLDTDGVNAFAAPGGYVHITRGALALIKNEAELAGVLGHEIIHVTEKHTIKAIQKSKAVQMGAAETLSGSSALMERAVTATYDNIVERGFGRAEENESDEMGVTLANKIGYAPNGLVGFLTTLKDRNKESKEKRGLFASHPEMQERLDRITKLIASKKLTATATVQPRYAKNITYKPVAVTAIAIVDPGAAGLAGGDAKAAEKAPADGKAAEKTEEPKKKGFGLGRMLPTGGGEKKSAQVTASGGARGVDPEKDSKGGSNPKVVPVKIVAADVAAFKKEGGLP